MEVVSANERLRRRGHDTTVERVAHMPGAAGFQRRQYVAIPNPVTINFPLRRETGVKRFSDEPAAHDSDLRGQKAIQCGTPSLRAIASSWKIGVSALRDGVHTGIRPACSVDADALRTDLFERVFEMVLNAVAVSLALPTRERPAVIGDDQL
jgi:hypothetical protein